MRKSDPGLCEVCGGPIAEGRGVYIAWLGLRVHYGACNARMTEVVKDRSVSKRGRFRKRSEVLRLLRERREQP